MKVCWQSSLAPRKCLDLAHPWLLLSRADHFQSPTWGQLQQWWDEYIAQGLVESEKTCLGL
jgi:hypothetical protein